MMLAKFKCKERNLQYVLKFAGTECFSGLPDICGFRDCCYEVIWLKLILNCLWFWLLVKTDVYSIWWLFGWKSVGMN
ncbi:unnamed protein product [Adineta ricciae]|uniref:Uncharacterized protein n=1 Tax=Adineta ricciae TaxID=249248 RepID=A0A816GBP0_ADIRI|nr:unnamed protein product [Adineta ricciae]